jgi:hypothetical protein
MAVPRKALRVAAYRRTIETEYAHNTPTIISATLAVRKNMSEKPSVTLPGTVEKII